MMQELSVWSAAWWEPSLVLCVRIDLSILIIIITRAILYHSHWNWKCSPIWLMSLWKLSPSSVKVTVIVWILVLLVTDEDASLCHAFTNYKEVFYQLLFNFFIVRTSLNIKKLWNNTLQWSSSLTLSRIEHNIEGSVHNKLLNLRIIKYSCSEHTLGNFWGSFKILH